MKLYKETGTNPLVQLPADHRAVADLLRAVPRASYDRQGPTVGRAQPTSGACRPRQRRSSASRSPRPSCTRTARPCPRPRSWPSIMIVLMTATTFTTQRQLMVKNQPLGAVEPDGAAAEDPALRLPADVRRHRHQLPHRRPHLLAHHEPVDDGPAVLRDPAQPAARERGVRRLGTSARPQGATQGRAADRSPQNREPLVVPAAARQQPKRQSKAQRKARRPASGATGEGRRTIRGTDGLAAGAGSDGSVPADGSCDPDAPVLRRHRRRRPRGRATQPTSSRSPQRRSRRPVPRSPPARPRAAGAARSQP